jgi:glycosyltransferase involved in cell wall biosynthesis
MTISTTFEKINSQLKKPELSVVICTYNRDKWILAALESTLKQTLAKAKYEVLVINNNCTDNSEAIIDEFIGKTSELNIRHIKENQQGLSFARNRGLSEAKSDLILYMDDDAIADEDLFEKIVRYMHQHPDVVGLGGKVTPIYEGQKPVWLNPYLIMMVTEVNYGDKEIICKGKKYPPGCNMTYRTKVLKDVGGFNNDLKWRVDDKYIFLKVQEVSKNIRYLPTLNVGHNIDEDRTTDENFDNLSLKLGHDERRRVKSLGLITYLTKIVEYSIKWIASIGLGIIYATNGNIAAGRYIARFRWQALLGLLNLKNFTK